MWRGATTNKSIKGYGDSVITNHKKTQSNAVKPAAGLPPKSSASSKRPPID